MEGDIDYFITTLIKSKPQNPKSIQLEILNDKSTSEKDIFNFLVEIFTKIMKRLFGDSNGSVNLDIIDENNSNLITDYFKSFSMMLYFEKYNLNGDIVYKNYKNNIETNGKNKLNEDCLNIRTNNFRYKFFFDYL